jgi:UDP-N-acetylmuramate--alanine ligase
MSALAELVHRRGGQVSGCDARPNQRSARLAGLGVAVAEGHDVAHLRGVDRLVYNTDVPADLPERALAPGQGVRVVHRSDLLAEALAGAFALAVTGTHGKTTTTALITHLLTAAGLDPTGIVGGEVDAWGGGLRLGRPDLVVAEADESDASFLRYHPHVAVVTNVEPEHLEHYGGSFARVVEAYERFVGGMAEGGRAVIWAGDPSAARLAAAARARGVARLYGEEPKADIRALDVAVEGGAMAFRVARDGLDLGPVRLSLPGRHNVHNALAAVEASLLAGAAFERLAPALGRFTNAHRRFEILYSGDDGRVVDDYAHHPSEIRAELAAARLLNPGRVCAVFQPQRYSRTKNLWDGFLTAFDDADEVMLLDVYAPAGEAPLPGVSGAALARELGARRRGVRYAPSLEAAEEMSAASWRAGDLWLFMGAGDVWRAAHALARRAARRAGATPPDEG